MEHSNVRHLRRVGAPLASYFRVGQRDAPLMAKLIEQGHQVASGVIVDAASPERTADLRSTAAGNGVEVILDTRGVELSMIGGLANPSISKLPWAHDAPHTVEFLGGSGGDDACAAIAETARLNRVTAVLAPSHFLDLDPGWLQADISLASRLREALDTAEGASTAIYYPLVASLRTLCDPAHQQRIVSELRGLASSRSVDGIFLRVHSFGTTAAGPINLRSYFTAARALHDIGLPLVGERTGTVGVALAAFGVVGGVESSITFGDGYDARRLLKPPTGKGFVPPPRTYLQAPLALVSTSDASKVLARRGYSRFGCQLACCAHDRTTLTRDARRHFVVARTNEMNLLSAVPTADRAEHYLVETLVRARDASAQLARYLPELPGIVKHRNRLDDWFIALQRTAAEDAITDHTNAIAPTGHRFRRSA